MCIRDRCTPFHVNKTYTESSMRRSHRWATRSLNRFNSSTKYKPTYGSAGEQKLYGIVQGGIYEDLREESIDFKELTVPILNGKCLTPVEIITKESFYNFNAKYVNDDTELNEFIISDKKKMELEQICLKTLDIVQAIGWLRVDLMQDSNQNFYVLEVNTVPGMTSHSLFPKSAESIGLSYDELVNEIINAKS